MIPTDRRSALRALALFALAPMSALGVASGRARAAAPLTVPDAPLVLRRTIERELGENAMLSIARAWKCTFSRNGGGILVEGRQIEVVVNAPPSLAPLADIERRREVTGLFPAHLGPEGRFVGHGEPTARGARHAVDVAMAMIRDSALAPHAKHDAGAFLARLGKTAAELVSTVQTDLFYPVEGQESLARDLPLVEGVSGRLEVEWSARAQPSGLLECAEKRIVTRVEGSARRARECWELEAA